MWRRAVSTAALALLMVVLAGGPVEAASGGKHGGSTPPPTTGSCYVTPNPVAVGGQYTVNGSGFKAGELLDVLVQNSHGTSVLFPPVDSSGSFSISSYASWVDAYTVSVYDTSGRSPVYLTGCSFSAV